MVLQSIEDFDAEMQAADAAKVRTVTTKQTLINPNHLPKKPKKTVDPAALEAETAARTEMANENWTNKLKSSFNLP